MLISYNWLCDYLGEKAPTPEEVVTLLTQHAFEIDGIEKRENDTVIDVDVLPNRSSDCLSHRGIAREIAAIMGISLAWDPLATPPELPTTDTVTVDIKDTKACPRFTASLLQSVTVKPSPEWLQERLRALGQRPINNVVDVTNYVMYGLGQPMHAYDADKFPKTDGAHQFGVRLAKPQETIALLGEAEAATDRVIELGGEELLITEATKDTPIGLAGVKGGTFAGVDDTTTAIILEAAHFDPIRTRKTARRHKIVIDASKRFENEPSRELPLYAQAEALRLLKETGAVQSVGVCDVYPEPVTAPTVVVKVAQANTLLGTELSATTMTELLQRVGCTIESSDNQTVVATGPWERTDLVIAEDMIEEIGRLYGYHHVAPIVPVTQTVAEYSPVQYYSEAIRQVLLTEGFSEVITSSFRKKDTLKLRNAMASDKSFLRSGLTKNLQATLDTNIHHTDLLGLSDIRVFEIGTVFTKGETGVVEHVSLAFGVRIRPTGYSGKEDAILKQTQTALESLLGSSVRWEEEKGVAETNFSTILQSLPDPTAYEPVIKTPAATYRPYSTYPAVSRDIALWVPADVTSDTVAAQLEAAAGEWYRRITLFDTFEKDGRVSYAFRLVFQSFEKTLTDVEVNACMDNAYAVASQEGWEVR